MAALTKERSTNQWGDDTVIGLLPVPVLNAVKIYQGSIVVATGGYARPGRTATGDKCIGMAWETQDNTSGAAGALTVNIRRGTFKFGNADSIAQADFGKVCYVVDDQTVSLDGTGKSVAGVIMGVDSDGGVWVELGVRPTAL